MTHTLVYESESDTEVLYRCSTCGKPIGFVKPGLGDPHVADDGAGGWVHPENPETWMGPCE